MLELVLHGAPKFEDEHPYLEGVVRRLPRGVPLPKTYRVKKGTKPEGDRRDDARPVRRGDRDVDLSYAKKRNLNVRDVVTIASIIEREVRLPREFPLVSSVIYNRLKLPMRLQLDSTVFYSLPEGTKVLTQEPTWRRRRPWNTYRRDGLPLTPICNPGIKAHQGGREAEEDEVPLLRADQQGRLADVRHQLRRLPEGGAQVPQAVRVLMPHGSATAGRQSDERATSEGCHHARCDSREACVSGP